MDREEIWNKWKNEGCPNFVKEKKQQTDVKQPSKRPKQLTSDFANGSKSKVFISDNPEMAKLCNINHDNLNACKNANREYLPTLRDFFEEAIEQLDPVNQIEKQYHLINRTEWSWKALRLLAKRSAFYFMQNQNVKTITEYLEAICQKLGKELQIFTVSTPLVNPSLPSNANANLNNLDKSNNTMTTNHNTASVVENDPINDDEDDEEDIDDATPTRTPFSAHDEQLQSTSQIEQSKRLTNEERLTKLKQEFQMDDYQDDSQSSTSSTVMMTPSKPIAISLDMAQTNTEQQDNLVDELVMNTVSDRITSVEEWKKIAEKLSMDEDTIAFIESELSNNVREQCKKILLLWKVSKPVVVVVVLFLNFN